MLKAIKKPAIGLSSRVLSILLTITFLTQSVPRFASADIVSAARLTAAAEFTDHTARTVKIHIPEQYGFIEKTSYPALTAAAEAKKPLVFLVKDAHCNYEAQHNIAKILEVLIEDYGAGLVAIEGAAGDIDLSRYGRYTPGPGKQRAVDRFVKEGYVTGAEYLKINQYRELPFGIYGVENARLYADNFISFRQTWSANRETDKFFRQLTELTEQLKNKIYSEELKELDRKCRSFSAGELPLTDYVRYLDKTQSVNGSGETSASVIENYFVLI